MSVTCTPLDKETSERFEKLFKAKDLFMEYNPGKCFMTYELKNIVEEIRNFKVKKDDIWFISYPRTGSTWCQEMVWMLGSDLNYEKAKTVPQYLRAPVLEMSAVFVGEERNRFKEDVGKAIEWCRDQPSPRFIKTHLPLSLLPVELQTVKPKIVCGRRNPKDVAISMYYHMRYFHGAETAFEDFVEAFLDGTYTYGSYWSHCEQINRLANQSNVLTIWYEEMKKDLKSCLRRTAKFLEKDISAEQLEELEKYLSFENMKDNPMVNYADYMNKGNNQGEDSSFIRKGRVGGWREHMSDDMVKRFDELIQKYHNMEITL